VRLFAKESAQSLFLKATIFQQFSLMRRSVLAASQTYAVGRGRGCGRDEGVVVLQDPTEVPLQQRTDLVCQGHTNAELGGHKGRAVEPSD